jgi:ribosomal protein S18 acetylase RimI-like enzyme
MSPPGPGGGTADAAASKAAVLRGVRVRIPPRALRWRLAAGIKPAVSEILVRPGRAADADAIARVLVAGWRAGYRGLVPDEVLARLDVEERAARWRELIPDTTVLVAEHEGTLAGVAALAIPARELDDPAVGEITVLYVDPASWRRGVGRALADAAAAELRDAGCDVAVLWVFEANERARAFYAAFGFTPDGARRRETMTGLPEVRLRAALD